MAFPLENLRVLDLSQAISGPFAGRILCDLGADVVKVEWPRGDITNLVGKPIAGLSGLFTQMNVGKRGIAIDLGVSDGIGLVGQLVTKADVVIENFRPGVLDRAGLSYDELAKKRPGLIMLSISGFGRTSPEAGRQAFASVVHAESGLIARQSAFDGTPPTDPCLSLADSLSALHGTIALLAALVLRNKTGAGQHIDLSMLDSMVATDDYVHNIIDQVHDVDPHRGYVWEAPGGPIMVAANPRRLWSRFRRHTNAEDPRPEADRPDRIAARLHAFAVWVSSFEDRSDLIRELVAADLPWADVRTAEDVLNSPSLQARRVVAQVDDGAGGKRGVIRMPYRFSNADADVRGPAPAVGSNGHDVLTTWLDLPNDRIAALYASGAVWSPKGTES